MQPDMEYVPPYSEPYSEPYSQPEGLMGQTIDSFTAPEAPFFVNNPYINPAEVIEPEGLLSPYSETSFGDGGGDVGYGGGAGDYGNNFVSRFGDLEDADFAPNYLLY